MKIATYFTMFVMLFSFGSINAEVSEVTQGPKKDFSLDLEFRPRTEYRHGYRMLMPDDATANVYTDQRARIGISYTTDDFKFHASFQEIRVWGESEPRSTNGTIQAFEAYVEPSIGDNLSLRIGRQKIMYDNERLFAQNDWRQNGGSHDAVRLMYKKDNLSWDIIGAYNQEKGAFDRFFETDYSPGFQNYKLLVTGFLKYELNENIILTMMNIMDGFQDTADFHLSHLRFTNGGRFEYKTNNYYATLAAFVQFGETPFGATMGTAYYLQPEFKAKVSNSTTLRLGAELASGNDMPMNGALSTSFDPLYGVNHRFMGFMDYFIRFPNDVSNAGLIAPYLMAEFKVTNTLTLGVDGHIFLNERDYIHQNEVIDKYLGFENDFTITWKANSFTVLRFGYSYMLPTESMRIIKKGETIDRWQDWAYLMVTFKPNLLKL